VSVSDRPEDDASAMRKRWLAAIALFSLTLMTTVYAGARNSSGREPTSLAELASGLWFGLPLMAILLSHELGHYFTARLHGVQTSPPYFLPMPPQMFLIGTMGAVIAVRSPVRSRNVMVDFAIAGPLAGLAVSVVVLCAGLAQSPIRPVDTPALIEGRSLAYLGLLHLIKGPIPDGMDVFLSPMAFAGWVGFLVTMINLVPFGQLDGGHLAEAVLGRRFPRFSRRVAWAIFAFGIAVGVAGVRHLLALGHPLSRAAMGAAEGTPWIVWCVVQILITRLTRGGADGDDDLQTEALATSEPLTPLRSALVALAGVCFVLLFMPWWMRQIP
jgi:membrane-associated protease RseP (regulator of RpoE activity)